MGQLIQHSISGFRHINFSGLKQAFVTKEAVFSFPIVNFPFLVGDVCLALSYGLYISNLVRIARISNNVSDFHDINLVITETLLH